MSEEFERGKAFLQQADAKGNSVRDHLTAVLLKLLKDKPANALEMFENLSVQVKQGALTAPVFRELPAKTQDSEARKKLLGSVERTSQLCTPPTGEDDEAPAKGGEESVVPDLMADAELLEWAGVNLGKEEMYKIMLSILALTKQEEFVSVRFFGKIFGTQRDYLIIEAKLAEYPEEEKDEETKNESFGSGANEYAYYVTNTPEGKWTMLPPVTAEQIITARQMRRFFTGNLAAPVLGFPRFPWGEASYLRAQIARITHSTLVSPAGFYQLDDEEEEETMIPNEEFAGLSAQDLATAENWSHHRSFLLKQGRTTPWVEPEKEDGDDEEEDKKSKEEEEEDRPALLTDLEKDASKGVSACWTFRLGPNASNPHAVASAHSLLWPGAVTVAKKKHFCNIYVGYGHKYLPTAYTPPPPPAIQTEYVPTFDAAEGETNPLEEQKDPEPQKEEERKDGDENGDDDDGDDDGDAEED